MTKMSLSEIANKMAYGYHYKVENFTPRTDISMGAWGFSIELDYDFAKECYKYQIEPDWKKRLDEKCHENVVAAQGKDYPLFRHDHYNFWDETLLMTNCSVFGNACGLDMEYNNFDDVKRDHPRREYSRVGYHPHNVDTIWQAVALLICFTTWYDMVPFAVEHQINKD